MRYKYFLILIVLLTPLFTVENYGIAVDKDSIYICQPESSRVLVKSRADNKQIFINSTSGYDLSAPVALSVANGYIYILDSYRGELVRFHKEDKDINFDKVLMSELFQARDIALWQNLLLILDSKKSQIIVYNLKRQKIVRRFGQDHGFYGAYGLAITPYGDIYVADTFHHRIIQYDINGNFISSYGVKGSKNGRLSYPRDVTVGYGDYYYIADSGNGRVVAVNKNNSRSQKLEVNKSNRVRLTLFLDQLTGQLYISAGDTFYKSTLSQKKISVELLSRYFSPQADGVGDSPQITLKTDFHVDVSLELLKEAQLMTSKQLSLDRGFHLLGLGRLDLEQGKYQLRVIVKNRGSKEPLVYQYDTIADTTPPAIEELLMTPNLKEKRVYHYLSKISYRLQCKEPSLLFLELQDKQRQTIDKYNSVVARKKFHGNWQFEKDLWQQLEGEYILRLYLKDRAGNTTDIVNKKIELSKKHLIFHNVVLPKIHYKQNDRIIIKQRLLSPADIKVSIYPIGMQGKQRVLFMDKMKTGDSQIEIILPAEIEDGKYFLEISAKDRKDNQDSFLKVINIDNSSPAQVSIAVIKNSVAYGNNEQIKIKLTYPEDVKVDFICQEQVILNKEFQKGLPGIILWDAKIDDAFLPPGNYRVGVYATDIAGNISYKAVTINIVAFAPVIEKITLSRKILSYDGYPGYNSLDISYIVAEGSGEVEINLRIMKNGQVIDTPIAGFMQLPGKGVGSFSIADRDIESGIYQYILKATNSRGISSTRIGDFYCVHEKPLFQQFSYDQEAISPADKDSQKDEVHFLVKPYHSIFYDFAEDTELKPLMLRITIKGETLDMIRYVELKQGLEFFTWNGLDEYQQPVKDGSYQLSFRIIDPGGVVSDETTAVIVVANSDGRIVEMGSSSETMSYNSAESTNNISFVIEFKYLDVLQKTSAFLLNQSNQVVRNWPELEFTGSANYSVSWDGTDDAGCYVNDGNYFLNFRIVDEAGNDYIYTYEQFPKLKISYLDQQTIRDSDGVQICSPSVTINASSEVEYNYCKSFESLSVSDRNTVHSPGGSHCYFIMDHATNLPGGAFTRSNNDLIVRIVPLFSGQVTYTLPDDGPYSYPTDMSYQPGRYYLQLDNTDGNWGSGQLSYSAADVWFKEDDTDETQVDALPLDLDGVNAQERKLRMGCIRVSADTIDYSHRVKIENSNVYYKRSQSIGSQQGTEWIQISQANKQCLEPSITAFPLSNDLYVCWIQRDTVLSDPYLVSQILPENFRPVNQDNKSTFFSQGENIIAHGDYIKQQTFSSFDSLVMDYHITYPNPFYEQVTIRYQLSTDADVRIDILDISGRLVSRLEYTSGSEGGAKSTLLDKYNDVFWDGRDNGNRELAAGPYLYIITAKTANGQKVVKKGKMVKWRR